MQFAARQQTFGDICRSYSALSPGISVPDDHSVAVRYCPTAHHGHIRPRALWQRVLDIRWATRQSVPWIQVALHSHHTESQHPRNDINAVALYVTPPLG